MFTAAFADYRVLIHDPGLPESHGLYLSHARLVDTFDLSSSEGAACFVAAGRVHEAWPSLVVEQRHSPASGGFHPGVLLAPDTDTLFIGAGTRLLAYRVSAPERLWEGYTDCGFWGWERHGQVALMLAELELAAWSVSGVKLWSFPVEPPWSHVVEGSLVAVEVMGRRSTFSLGSGPPAAS